MVSILTGITFLFALAWGVTALLRRASAALRHLIWTCAFGAVLLLAPLRWRLPQHAIAPALPAIASVTTAVSAGPARQRARPVNPAMMLLGVWALGTGVLTIRLVRNAIRLRSLIGSARGKGPILISSRVRGPVVAGAVRPVILLPRNADQWSVTRRRAVIAHETAHIRRRDPAILLAAHVATALYWFHPLCWLAAARLRAESERACDDAALRIGLRPSGYATDLLELARRFESQLAIPMASTSHLEARVKSILDPLTNRSFPARATWVAAIALTLAVLAPLTTFTLRAQQPAGAATITGIVSDPTGAVVPNAQVTATDTAAGYRETTSANMVGAYTFSNMPSGFYTIEVRAPGFAIFRADSLLLLSGGKVETDAHLIVGSLSERVTVAAQGTPQAHAVASGGPSRPIRVGGMVQATTLIQRVDPVYPGFLQAQGIEGTVLLTALISKEGVPTSLKVMKNPGHEEFVTAALEAVEQWRYKPTLLNGEPIEVLTSIQVDFKLSATAPVIDDRVLAFGNK
jgi:TonB family protein